MAAERSPTSASTRAANGRGEKAISSGSGCSSRPTLSFESSSSSSISQLAIDDAAQAHQRPKISATATPVHRRPHRQRISAPAFQEESLRNALVGAPRL
jgi:hypothetical protein